MTVQFKKIWKDTDIPKENSGRLKEQMILKEKKVKIEKQKNKTWKGPTPSTTVKN